MKTNFEDIPLSQLLKQREIFEIFDEEFRNEGWLDITALIGSDSSIKDIEADQTIPKLVLDKIKERLAALL